jgi:hypothetical protein
MLDGLITPLSGFDTAGRHSISGLSSGAFMTVQMHVAHSADFIGAGIIAGGPYRASESFRAALTAPSSGILNALYVAMTPLTPQVAPDARFLARLAQDTPGIDPTDNLKDQRLYIFTGRADRVVNQFAVRKTRDFYRALGVPAKNIAFVDQVDAGHSIITMNPEDSPLSTNQPPYINRGPFWQSHRILDHLYGPGNPPDPKPRGDLIRFEQAAFTGDAQTRSCMARFGYAYIPSAVSRGDAQAIGVHIVLHGCKQGYSYVDFVFGREDVRNQPPYGDRYVTTTGYIEWAEANNLILLFPQVDGGDGNAVQNPDGCWDWWGYTSPDPDAPDYYSQDAVQIKAINGMLRRLTGAD